MAVWECAAWKYTCGSACSHVDKGTTIHVQCTTHVHVPLDDILSIMYSTVGARIVAIVLLEAKC